MSETDSVFAFLRRRRYPKIVVEVRIDWNPRLDALRRLSAIQTQPDEADEAALIREVADAS